VLLKRTKAKLKRVSALESKDNRIRQSLTPEFKAMANKSLREFSTLTTANIHTRPGVNVGYNGFKLKPALINMVQASQFCEKAHEDASAHLQHFLEICSTFTIKGVTKDAIYSAFSCFHSWGRQNSGSMPTKKETPHGITASLPS
jgi:hypothetical protein